MSVIVRTAGIGKLTEELQWDLDVLVKLWDSIKTASKQHGAPVLIHQESDIAIRAVRDHLRQNISEILVDDEEVYKKVYNYIERVRPDFLDRVKHYSDKIPLFSRFQLEKQIESAYQRNVRLPSGGEIVIDGTEALTAIDVNSAQSTKGGNIEETALHTNLEAADEIAKQLRIRDLAGLIVIDFIDMDRDENNYKVEDHMREALRSDRARVQLARLSRFGLLEMSRQRLRPTLSEASLVSCPRCHGQGSIRNVQSQAQSILHLIEESAQKKNITQVRLQLPIELATFMLNEQRHTINKIESSNLISIVIVANPYLQTPQYEIETLNLTSDKNRSEKELSYEMVSTPKVEYTPDKTESKGMPKRQAAVGYVLPDAPVPQLKKPKKPGFLSRFFKSLFGTKKASAKRQDTRHPRRPQQRTNSRYNKNQRNERTSRDQYRGRPRRTNGTGTNRRDDNRADTRKPTRSTHKPDTRENNTTRTRDNNRTDNRRPTRNTSQSDTQGDSSTRNQSENRSEKPSSDKPRQRQTQRSRSPRRPQTPRNTPREEQNKPIEKASRPEPILEKKIEPAIKPQAKPAPRHVHTRSTPKETDTSFQQVETAHKPKATPSHAEQNTPERPRRQRPQRPVKKTSPEDFEMIETKN